MKHPWNPLKFAAQSTHPAKFPWFSNEPTHFSQVFFWDHAHFQEAGGLGPNQLMSMAGYGISGVDLSRRTCGTGGLSKNSISLSGFWLAAPLDLINWKQALETNQGWMFLVLHV